ncbi:MAG: hypothetical protein SVR08_18335 [Spirochaetota bacterium]|nr:hypothetical protein [Spirochaetota bacterium]
MNGKEVAVLGSKVKTCADPADMENCSIFALGAAVPLPIKLPGMDEDEFKRWGGTVFNTRNPYASKEATERSKNPRILSAPMWDRATATVGEEVTLSVNVTNQYQGANVYFTIWKDGADRDKDMPVGKVYGHHDNGKAEAKWRYMHIEDPENPTTEKPKFIFTAKSFKCKEVKSGSIEIGRIIETVATDDYGNILKDHDCAFQFDNGEIIKVKSDSEGKAKVEDAPFCGYSLIR